MVLADSVSITSDSAPNNVDWPATNLIQNPGTRVSNSVNNPRINFNGDTDTGIKSCYQTNQANWPDTNTFILGIDLAASYFIHAILLVEDVLTSVWSTHWTIIGAYADTKHRFQRFEVYIGDSSNYLDNEKVEGGPWLYDPADSNDPDYTTFGIYDVWAFGKEIWPNK